MRRTWRERLFTRPWHPLQRTKTITPQVPKRGGYFIGQNQMIVIQPSPQNSVASWRALRGPTPHESRN